MREAIKQEIRKKARKAIDGYIICSSTSFAMGRGTVRKAIKEMIYMGELIKVDLTTVSSLPLSVVDSLRSQAESIWEDGHLRDCIYRVSESFKNMVITDEDTIIHRQNETPIGLGDFLNVIENNAQTTLEYVKTMRKILQSNSTITDRTLEEVKAKLDEAYEVIGKANGDEDKAKSIQSFHF